MTWRNAAEKNIDSYIASAKRQPFFYVVRDDQYNKILEGLCSQDFKVDRVSDFCSSDDKIPNLDHMIDYFRKLSGENRRVLVGLGEYLALKGGSFADNELRRLEETTFSEGVHIVLLLRCVSSRVCAMLMTSACCNRIKQQKRIFSDKSFPSNLQVRSIKYSLKTDPKTDVNDGFKALLRAFEDGGTGTLCVYTNLDFPDSLIPVRCINSAYAAIGEFFPNSGLKENWGKEEQWKQLFQKLSLSGCSLNGFFDSQGFKIMLINNSIDKILDGRQEFDKWLFFLYLKKNIKDIPNGYLRCVVEKTEKYDGLKNNILNDIIRISREDKNFRDCYEERKELVRNFSQKDIDSFIYENNIDTQESIYRFTDNTLKEREEIIKWISSYGRAKELKELEYIYPALHQYLGDYVFDCKDKKLSDELTSYFREYRSQKIRNTIDPEFLNLVNENAKSLSYAHLESRDSAVLRIENKNSAFLYWIDALGVEYLPYITELAKENGLSVNIDITYCELPSITSRNREFYENWSGPRKEKESELDDIKHKDKGGFVFDEEHEAPIHLAAELEVIERAIKRAAQELSRNNCESFVIASDHGASRLAVIRRQEEKYETDTKGEHSGRCCKEFPDADLPCAIRENGYYVLADYGRFKKSRAANVEVHGGATLEEVIVPVITLKLKKQNLPKIQIANKENIQADRKNGTKIVLYITGVENPDRVGIIIESERHAAERTDSTHFTITLSGQKRSRKNISADVYDGDNLIGNIVFDIKGKFDSIENKDFKF